MSADEASDEAQGFEASEDEKEFLGRKEWAICVATFYDDLAERLVGGAVGGLRRRRRDAGVDSDLRGAGRIRAAVRGEGMRGRRRFFRHRLPRRRHPR